MKKSIHISKNINVLVDTVEKPAMILFAEISMDLEMVSIQMQVIDKEAVEKNASMISEEITKFRSEILTTLNTTDWVQLTIN